MQFRLTYEGSLRAKQRDALGNQRDHTAAHTQQIRRVFHKQLKNLWSSNKFLRNAQEWEKDFDSFGRPPERWARIAPRSSEFKLVRELIPNLYQEYGYRWLPLVREKWELLCELDILFLRNDPPGSALHAGDIDNRLKTLIDGLRRPISPNEMQGDGGPGPDEDPFFVLLEDDKNVTSLSVQTDTLLDPTHQDDKHFVKLVISVRIHPFHATTFNLGFS